MAHKYVKREVTTSFKNCEVESQVEFEVVLEGGVVTYTPIEVYVRAIHPMEGDTHKRCDIVERYTHSTYHKTSPQRKAWFDLAGEIVLKNLDLLDILN